MSLYSTPSAPHDVVCGAGFARRDAGLSDWRLYLVDWGYNTPPEQARAAAHPAITVINKAQFTQLLAAAE